MSLDARQHVLDQLAQQLDAPVIAYVTGDRPNLDTQIAADQLTLFPRHLDTIGKQKRLALLLYTRGGETHAAWPIANFLREYCDELLALIPFYAHSAGTLLTLGADQILMSRFATLSPIDPTVGNLFNPQDETNPATRKPIAVEDVMAFFELANTHKVSDHKLVFDRLSTHVHPLALGNVQRSVEQIRQLAEKMIALHSADRSKKDVKQIIRHLTTALYSHYHLISRREAKSLDLPVVTPEPVVEQLLVDYYNQLVSDLDLRKPFDPAALLNAIPSTSPAPPPTPPPPTQGQPPLGTPAGPPQFAMPPGPGPVVPIPVSIERAYIETTSSADAFITRGVVSMQPQQTPMVGGMPGIVMQNSQGQLVPTLQITGEGWETVQ
jgi:hypothetical protein